MPELAISASGLRKTFEDVEAVRGLDLRVRPGEMFGLVGPDGAGKTTTIRLLCGILRPASGTARVLGFDLLSQTDKIKENIGYLSQRFSLYGDLTVDENIEFFAEIHGVRSYRERREELLEFTRLKPFRRRLAGRLSGGMRQKLALACTLVHTPRLILLDEPTTGVDPVSRRDFWKILSGLLRQGVTIFMSTPYLDEAERCSSVGLMAEGRLIASGTPREVKARMKGEIIEVVCADVRRAAEALRASAGREEVQVFGDRLHVVVGSAARDAARIATVLKAAGLGPADWRAVPPSLENVFISLLEPGPLEVDHA
ncbi:MAG: multidrug ABC transporter ATP-binding protein [Candidatus Aminicenantes bacterium RBG_13_63_10]|nr:MAG: multidrug ABC transporter ATP-binding protein [Candidatus Aminicenantes bacterium RBG_13_63_10]